MQISFITPVGVGTELIYLNESYSEIEKIHSNVSWEWVVQFDGSKDQFGLSILNFTHDPRVKIAYNGSRQGVAKTRNNALNRSSKTYCLSLDSDDLIIPKGIHDILLQINDLIDVDFAIGECIDLFPNGRAVRRFAKPKLKIGKFAKWSLLKLWLVEGALFFQPGPVVYKTHALRAIGGWPHLPSVKDFELISTVLHVEGRGEGYYTGTDIYLYRQHKQQNTRTQNDEETALEIIKMILSKNPDSKEAIEMLRRVEAGDTSLVSISTLFSREWHEQNNQM